MLRLAQKFNRDFPNVPLIVHLFDPVLNTNQAEMNVTGQTALNPLDPDNFTYLMPMDEVFDNLDSVRIFNFVSGGPLCTSWEDVCEPFVGGVRAAIDQQADTNNEQDLSRDWYQQRYYDLGHVGIANRWWVIDDAMNHLRVMGDPLIQAYCETLPPVVRCSVTPSYIVAPSGTVTFEDAGSESRSGARIVSYEWRFSNRQTASGPGPHSFNVRAPAEGEYYLTGELTVTDALGNSSSRSCTAVIRSPFGDMK